MRRQYVECTYNVFTNYLKINYDKPCDLPDKTLEAKYQNDNRRFLIDFSAGKLTWFISYGKVSSVNKLMFEKIKSYHFIYLKYIECCGTGLIMSTNSYKSHLSKFYNYLKEGHFNKFINNKQKILIYNEFINTLYKFVKSI